MFDLQSYLKGKKRRVETALAEIMNQLGHPGHLSRAMTYSVMAGGKRIRPILFLAAADALACNDSESFIYPACSLELIHTYSLIHDDLPAMDNDDLRRGKPTSHIKFDEATAILAGDALVTLAFQVLSDPRLSGMFSCEKQVRLIHVISKAAGPEGMVQGQMTDIQNEGKKNSLSGLREMHLLKTGALIEASVVSGAILADADEDQIVSLKTYGRNIGIAFQVADDILNVEGDATLMGKSVGTDEEADKCTYPSLMGVSNSKEFARELVNNALKALDNFDGRALPLRAIAEYVITRKK